MKKFMHICSCVGAGIAGGFAGVFIGFFVSGIIHVILFGVYAIFSDLNVHSDVFYDYLVIEKVGIIMGFLSGVYTGVCLRFDSLKRYTKEIEI